MYKKVGKSLENPYGIIETEINSINKPIILFSVPSGRAKAVNGYLNRILYLLRLRKSEEISSSLDISEVPLDLYGSSNPKADIFSNIIDNLDIKDVSKMKRLFRNINFISYCDGNNKLLPLIVNIHDQLISKGFNENDTEEIMSQISVLQIVDNLNYEGNLFLMLRQ